MCFFVSEVEWRAVLALSLWLKPFGFEFECKIPTLHPFCYYCLLGVSVAFSVGAQHALYEATYESAGHQCLSTVVVTEAFEHTEKIWGEHPSTYCVVVVLSVRVVCMQY